MGLDFSYGLWISEELEYEGLRLYFAYNSSPGAAILVAM